VRYGAPQLKTTLVSAAWAGVRPMACDHVLRDGVPDRDLDPEHFAPRARLRILVAKSTRGMPHSGPLTGYL